MQVEYELYYEPYLLLPRKGVQLYDEDLLERMYDKNTYGLELYAKG
jgi:hypothetical protein